MPVYCMDGVICITAPAFDLTLLAQGYLVQPPALPSVLPPLQCWRGDVDNTRKESPIGYQGFAMERDPGSE